MSVLLVALLLIFFLLITGVLKHPPHYTVRPAPRSLPRAGFTSAARPR